MGLRTWERYQNSLETSWRHMDAVILPGGGSGCGMMPSEKASWVNKHSLLSLSLSLSHSHTHTNLSFSSHSGECSFFLSTQELLFPFSLPWVFTLVHFLSLQCVQDKKWLFLIREKLAIFPHWRSKIFLADQPITTRPWCNIRSAYTCLLRVSRPLMSCRMMGQVYCTKWHNSPIDQVYLYTSSPCSSPPTQDPKRQGTGRKVMN